MEWQYGKVEKILVGDFKFAERFTGLSDDLLSKAIQIVNAEFSGVYSLWHLGITPEEGKAKRELCISYLVGWWLTNSYPDLAVGVASNGAMPIKGKKIGPIALQYRDTVRQASGSVLDMLTTNEFGIQALAMIQTAPENFILMR